MSRLILKLLYVLAVLFLFSSCKENRQIHSNLKKPNIIVFMVDDMGWMDTSVPFYDSIMPLNQRYNTPNMERLSKAGVKFTNAYAQPVCTPTRVSYITGMNAARSRVTNWTSPFKDRNVDRFDDQFEPLEWNMNGWSNNVSAEHSAHGKPFPMILRDNGYYTIHVGKAHWGSKGTPGSNPYNVGFMVNIAGHAGGHPQSYLSEDQYGNIPGKTQAQAVPDLQEYYNSGVFLTEALTIEALKTLEVPIEREMPFYLNMSHYALHTPIMADERFVQKYYDAGIDSIEAKYASLIEGMDKSLGDIMDFLENRNISDETIIFFISDNGGLDHHQRGGLVNTHNYPLRSGKGSVYEGGIRVPMIVKWPQVIKSNLTNENPIVIEDFFPTILNMARISELNVPQIVDGQDLTKLLADPELIDNDRPLIFHYPHKWINLDSKEKIGINYYSAMRYGKWKLLYHMRDRSFELYDLSLDVGEKNNLAEKEYQVLEKLKSIFGQTLRKRKAQMPREKETGETIPYPDEIM